MPTKKRPVIVTTAHRGVFFGYTTNSKGDTVTLTDARCAIRFGTSNGWLELAKKGPNRSSKIGSTAPRIELRDITAVCDVTSDAESAWLAA